jgi:phenylalanyl-tRNA synthetase alpha chain
MFQITRFPLINLRRGAWKTSTFKKYNFEAEGAPTTGGSLHPLLKVREEIRNVFLEMGYMPFLPSLFPVFLTYCNRIDSRKCRQHPSSSRVSGVLMPCSCRSNILRETCKILSTFLARIFLVLFCSTILIEISSDPPHSLHPEKEYYKRVSTVHEHGGFGSTGYRAPWSHEETSKLLLRTHTTASSAHMLYKLAAKCRGENVDDDDRPTATKDGQKDDGFRPAKLFSIDRVFRNETMDATHLAEFHQVEGVVADRGLTLADLIGFMRVFFSKMGIKQVRFKPAYNPYTEVCSRLFPFSFDAS